MRFSPSRVWRRGRVAAAALPWRIADATAAWRRRGFAQAALVTIDVFDTALLRSVARPEDVFWLAAWRLGQRGNAGLDIEATAQARAAAEQAARAQARALGRDEVTLGEIYGEVDLDPALRDALMTEETKTERDVCFANPDMLGLYQQLLANRTPVAFISDTYFDGAFIAGLLRQAGFHGDIQVFASSDFGLSKADGRLFATVAQRMGADPQRIWHVGDNQAADVHRARAAGWNALWYRPALRSPREPSPPASGAARVAASLLRGVPASLRLAAPDASGAGRVWRDVGAGIAAPIYLGFAQYVARQAVHGGAQHVAFCARDGRIIRAVYQRLRKVTRSLPASSYLMVSRRSLVFPMIEAIGEAELDFLTAQFASLRVEEFLARINLDPQRNAGVLACAGLTPATLINSPTDMAALRRLLRDLAPEILRAAAGERALLTAYLAQRGVLRWQRLAFVDIGWQGSLQNAAGRLLASLGAAPRLQGLYFGTNPAIRNLAPEAGAASGWFVNAGLPAPRQDLIRAHWAVLELLFTAPHGSVLGYREGPAGIEPVLDGFAAPGMPEYEQAAAQIQAAALAAIDRFLAAFGGVPAVPVTAEAVEPKLRRLALMPSLAEARAIGDLFHVDGFGATRTGQYIARPPALPGWPGLRAVVAGLRGASWRRGYIVRTLGGPRAALAAIAAIGALRPGFKSI